MYIDLGNDHVVPVDEIVAIMDSNSALSSEDNHKIIVEFEKNGDMIYCSHQNFIKSYVLCEGIHGKKIYSCSFGTKLLKDRLISPII